MNHQDAKVQRKANTQGFEVRNRQDNATRRDELQMDKTAQSEDGAGKLQTSGSTRQPPAPIPEKLNQVAHEVVDAAFSVHSTLGPGLLESVYETCLAYELKKCGLSVRRQVDVPVRYDEMTLDAALRIDLMVEDSLVVEIKSVDALNRVHTA